MRSIYLDNLHYFCGTTAGYKFPNSFEGDLLKTGKREIEALMNGVTKLAKAIQTAERHHTEVCLNGTIAQQSAASSKVDTLKFAFAVVTGTAVGGAQFDQLLNLGQIEPRVKGGRG